MPSSATSRPNTFGLSATDDLIGGTGRRCTETSVTVTYRYAMAEWTIADAWVFAALSGTGPKDGSSLSQVIAHADGINHAILNEAEFVQAIPRLQAAGLVGADPAADRYWRTEAGHQLHATKMKRRGLFGWIEAIPPALGRLGEPQDSDWVLGPGVFQAAVREYLYPAKRRRKTS
jgi:hypothetical protein